MCIDLSSPNLDEIKKQARNLLHALRRRDAIAVNRYYPLELLAEQFNLPQVNESVAPGPGFDHRLSCGRV